MRKWGKAFRRTGEEIDTMRDKLSRHLEAGGMPKDFAMTHGVNQHRLYQVIRQMGFRMRYVRVLR